MKKLDNRKGRAWHSAGLPEPALSAPCCGEAAIRPFGVPPLGGMVRVRKGPPEDGTTNYNPLRTMSCKRIRPTHTRSPSTTGNTLI